jgi:hypothetical protein
VSIDYVYTGAAGSESLHIDIVATPALPDLTAVTAATLLAIDPHGASTTWSISLVSQTATTLRLTHVFDVTDVPIVGTYKLQVSLSTAGGALRCAPLELKVRAYG